MRVLLVLLAMLVPAVSEACRDLTDFAMDNKGNVQVNADVYIYYAGTTTTVPIYSDKSCTQSLSNPVQTNIDGGFQVFIKDAIVDLVVSKSGLVFLTRSNLTLFSPLGNNIVTPATYGTTDLCANATGILDQIGANVRELWINVPVNCNRSVATPITLTIREVPGGSITTALGVTFGVNGPVHVHNGATFWAGAGTYAFAYTAGPRPYGEQLGLLDVLYGATVTPDNRSSKTLRVPVTDTNNFTVAAPTDYGYGRELTIWICNEIGGGGAIGTITWNAVYKLATFTKPADGFRRAITFKCNGLNCHEVDRSTVDVPN